MPAITTNIAANSAVRYLNINSNQETSALSKLSSGSRITSASDDAAGLAISTRISSDVTALQQAATNAAQANAILQTADGGASNISDILARMKSLASESASGTTVATSRPYIDAEFQQLTTDKGAMIFHMLRWVMGNADFDRTVKNFLLQNAGKSVRAETHEYQVIGVAERIGSAFGQSQDNFMIMPIHTFEKQLHRPRDWVGIFVQARNTEMMGICEDEARMLLRAWRHLPSARKHGDPSSARRHFAESAVCGLLTVVSVVTARWRSPLRWIRSAQWRGAPRTAHGSLPPSQAMILEIAALCP